MLFFQVIILMTTSHYLAAFVNDAPAIQRTTTWCHCSSYSCFIQSLNYCVSSGGDMLSAVLDFVMAAPSCLLVHYVYLILQ